MTKECGYHVNPFAVLQANSDEKIIFLTNKSDIHFMIDDPTHPLFSIDNINDLDACLPRLNNDDINMLTDAGVISQTAFNRRKLLAESYHEINTPASMYLTIFPTLNCNNSCVYCYQKHEGQTSMTDGDYSAILVLINESIGKGVKDISYNVLGGEGTLKYKDVSNHLLKVRHLCEEKKVTFNGSMTTNGRLLRKEAITKALLKAGISSFQVTLDGPPSIHNKTRLASDNADSHKETLAGLLALKKLGGDNLSCTIRTNHTTETIIKKNLDEHFKILKEHFAGDERFVFYNVLAADLGGNIDKTKLVTTRAKQQILRGINRKAAEIGLFLKSDVYLPNGRVCYAARANSLVIMPGLKLKKCTVALDEPVNDIGFLSHDGTLHLNENVKKWTDIDNNTSKKCSTCRVAPICQGKSCPQKQIISGVPKCPDIKTDNKFMIRNIHSLIKKEA